MPASWMRRTLSGSRWFATQVAVSVVATGCIAALYGAGTPPASPSPAGVETGKSARRVADGAVDTTVLRYDAQQQAALASFASFTPTAAPILATAPVVTRAGAKTISVLPPPRPTMAVHAVETPITLADPTQSAVSATKPAEGWRVAGLEIPGSAKVRGLIPNSDDILQTGSSAWTASTKAVRTVGGFLGL